MISVTILTKDSADTIQKTLESTNQFNEVIVLDSGSSDNTLKIARTFPNVKIHQKEFTTFGEMKNAAAKLAKNDWVLSLDSDEELSLALIENLLYQNLHSDCVYEFPFHNFFNGKWIKHAGWYPDKHIRLYNRKKTHFSAANLHEKILEKDLKIVRIKHPINHYSYRNMSHFLSKMQLYSSLFAKEHQYKKKSSFIRACVHGFFAFIKTYILKRGFLSGKEGFLIAVYNANTAFYKYLKLAEANKQL